MDAADLYLESGGPPWKAVAVRAEALARTPWPVLLLGPRGSGKTLLARYIHELSGRSGQFMAAPAPSVPDSLLQSELLGHARGAFTDARDERKGLLELAHQGTLFLDEIEAASYSLQSFLVGQVEQAEVRRVGDSRARKLDVRFIYATNSDLRHLSETGRFRPDLLDRIGALTINVPALSEYRLSILRLATRFLREDLEVLGRALRVEFAVDTQLLLLRYPWPGNLRELRTACRAAAINLSVQRPVLPEDFPQYLAAAPRRDAAREERAALREQVAATLREVGGNKSEAARRLNMQRSKFLRMFDRLSRKTPVDGQPRPA